MRTLTSGTRIANRYELVDLVSERFSSMSWRAHDPVLQRSVGLQVIGVDDDRVDAFLTAARVSAAVTDPRFLRVLDIIEDYEGNAFILREWARAFPLDHLLSESPLSNDRAAGVVFEVAEAIAAAHEQNVYHRHLTPHGVLLKRNGAVRISGLATAAALAGHFDENLVGAYEQHDVDSIGWLLYACLTGRWPGGPIEGLREAPRAHGELLRPRQVTAGVLRGMDDVVDRILSGPDRGSGESLRHAADIAVALDDLGLVTGSHWRGGATDVSRLDPVEKPSGPPPGIEPPRRRPKALEPPPPTRFEVGRRRMKTLTRGHRAMAAVGVLGAIALAAFLLWVSQGTDPSDQPTEASTPGPTDDASEFPIVEAIDFDPQGDGVENPDLTDLVSDGDPETGWRTIQYFNNPEFGGLKDGVGLIIDLGVLRTVGSVDILLGGGPMDLTVYHAGANTVDPPDELDGLSELGSSTGASRTVSLSSDEGVVTRFLVVWITRLPEVTPARFQGEIREIEVSPPEP